MTARKPFVGFIFSVLRIRNPKPRIRVFGSQSKKGFTLVELLVVMAIVSVLATGVYSTVVAPGAQQRTVDANRMQDLAQIKTSLEVYYQDHNCFPSSSTSNFLTSLNAGTTWTEGNTVYMRKIPKDPSKIPYNYIADGAACPQWISLFAHLSKAPTRFVACSLPSYSKTSQTCLPSGSMSGGTLGPSWGCVTSGSVTCNLTPTPIPTVNPSTAPTASPTLAYRNPIPNCTAQSPLGDVDANGRIDANDWSSAVMLYDGHTVKNAKDFRADVNQDGVVNNTDSGLINTYISTGSSTGFVCAPAATPIPTATPIPLYAQTGWWKLDENSGNTALDSSLTGNNGQVTAGPSSTGLVAYYKLDENGGFYAQDTTANRNTGTLNTYLNLADWLKFDEGSGPTGVDSSGNGRTGTLTGGATWLLSPNCKIGNCVNVNTTSSVVQIPTTSVGANWTITSWFKYPLPVAGCNTLTRGSNDHQVIVQCGGTLLGTFNNSVAPGGFVSSGFNMATLTAGWHHLAAVGTGGSTLFYIDGNYVGTAAYQSGNTINPQTGSTVPSDISYVGNYQGGNQQFGTIDDFRIYNRALSAAEIAAIYNNTAGPTWSAPGKFGDSALSFNGTSDYVSGSTPTINYNPVTFSLWINESASRFGTFLIGKSGYGGFLRDDGTGNYVWDLHDTIEHNVSAPIPSYNAWHLVTGTYDGNIQKIYVDGVLKSSSTIGYITPISTNDIGIGGCIFCGPGQITNGSIDEVRIYSRALSQSEITDLYNNTVPPSWISNGAVGGALSLNGAGDYVTVPNNSSISPTNQVSVAGWFNVRTLGSAFGNFVSKRNSYILHPNPDGSIYFYVLVGAGFAQYSAPPGSIQPNTWQYWVGTYDGQNAKLYLNGVQTSSFYTVAASGAIGTTGNLYIGNDGGCPYNGCGYRFLDGMVDDVRVYDYALSQTEIASNYQLGANSHKMLGWWKLNGDTTDSSNNGNSLSAFNLSYAAAIENQGAYFNGSNTNLQLASPTRLHSDREVSLTGWFKLNALPPVGSWNTIFWKGDTPDCAQANCPNREYSMWVGNSATQGPFLHFNSTSADNTTVGQTACNYGVNGIAAGLWYHFAAIVDSNSGALSLYLNGVKQQTYDNNLNPISSCNYSSAGIRTTSGPFEIGSAPAGGYINGYVDDFRVYNYALSASEIGALYSAYAPVVTSTTISAPIVTPDNSTQYTVTLTSQDPQGGNDISLQAGFINVSDPANYRGYFAWMSPDIWGASYEKAGSLRTCTIDPPGSNTAGVATVYYNSSQSYGSGYINTVPVPPAVTSCSTSVSGNIRTTKIILKFDTSFSSPVNNTLYGWAQDTVGLYDARTWVAGSSFSINQPPTISSATIDNTTVTTNGTNQYTITVTGSDANGSGDINQEDAYINYGTSNQRGWLSWSPTNAWVTGGLAKGGTSVACTGSGGGYGAIYWDPATGANYINSLVSCTNTTSGTTTFTVKFDPTYETPINGNVVSGKAYDAGGYASAWTSGTNFNLTCTNGYYDSDHDGYGSGFSGCFTRYVVATGTDCAPSDPSKWVNQSLYLDSDGDTYGAGSIQTVCTNGTTPAGYSTLNTDCYDSGTNAANAHPTQASYFGTPRGDGIYDYNCNATIESNYARKRTTSGACSSASAVVLPTDCGNSTYYLCAGSTGQSTSSPTQLLCH